MAAKWEGAWQQLLSLCRRRGFIAAQQLVEGKFPTKDGYLTLGTALKRNIANEWYYNMVTLRQEIHPLEGAVLRPHHPAPPLLLHHTAPSQNLMNATRDNRLQDGRDNNNNNTAKCLLTKTRLPPEATFPFSPSTVASGKLAVEAPTAEAGKEWASRIREELAPGAKVYRRQNRILLYVKEMTDTYLTLKAKNDCGSVTVPHCGVLSLTSGSPFLVKEESSIDTPTAATLTAATPTAGMPTAATPTAATPTAAMPTAATPTAATPTAGMPTAATPTAAAPTAATPTAATPTGDTPTAGSATPQPSSPTSPEKRSAELFGREKDYSLLSAASSSALKQDLSSGAESFLRDSLTRTLTERARDVQAVLNLCLPFGLATIGPVFKAVPAPLSEQHDNRMSEFDKLDVTYFCHANETHNMYLYWQKQRLRWWKQYAENPDWFVLSEHPSEDLPNGLINASAIQFAFPWGSGEVESMECHAPSQDGTTLLSMSAGLDRGVWAFLWDALWCREGSSGAGGGGSGAGGGGSSAGGGGSGAGGGGKVLRMNAMLSPFKVAVMPEDTASTHQLMFAKQLSLELRHLDIVTRLSDRGSVEERHRCEDESGTPYCIIVDDNTLNCGVLHFRDRNSSLIECVHKDDLIQTLQARLRRYRLFKGS